MTSDEGQPVNQDKFERDFHNFFSGVGYAITRWAHVDRALFDFCQFSLNTSKEKTAVVFYRTPNIKDHLVLVDALMHLSLAKRHMKRWEKICKAVNEHLPYRNYLAHNPPTQVVHLHGVVGEPEFEVPPPQQWWEIRIEETKTLHKKRKPIQAKLEHIATHIRAVNQLLHEMYALKKALKRLRS